MQFSIIQAIVNYFKNGRNNAREASNDGENERDENNNIIDINNN